MSVKPFLTSGLILGLVVSPAIADTLYNNDIVNSCNVDILGSSSGNATNSFTAQYAPNKYTSAPGTYLLFNNNTISENQTCPTGSYCPGFTNQDFTDSTMGLNSCPSAYSLSAAGSKTEAECYRQCTSADVAHSKATGTFTGMFYSNNTNACEPVNDASCADGYHYKAGSTGLNVGARINGDILNEDSSTMTWDTSFIYGNITGKALCSTTNGEWATTGTPDESTGKGQYCWCQIDGFTPTNGSKQSLSGSWVFAYDDGDADNCANDCAYDCAVRSLDTDNFRAALFGSVGASPAICEANEITVTWNPNNGQPSSTNTCTYGGDITLPTAPTKAGYTFSGWKLVTPSAQ